MSKRQILRLIICCTIIFIISYAGSVKSDSSEKGTLDEVIGKANPFKRVTPEPKPEKSFISKFVSLEEKQNEQLHYSAENLSAPLYIQTVMLKFLEAENLQRAVRKLNSEVGEVAVDTQSNSLIIADTRQRVDWIVKQIKKADQTPKQILIEVVILDVKLNDDTEVGVDWNFLFGPNQSIKNTNNIPFGGVDADGNSSFYNTGSQWNKVYNQTLIPATLASGGVWGFLQNGILVTVKALQQTRNVEILASPRVLVVSGQEAIIKTVEEIPYQEVTKSTGGGGGANAITSTEFKEVGVTLLVKATLTDEQNIMMSIRPEQSVQTGSSNDGVPVIDSREVETTLLMEDGQIVVIGGLRRKETTLSQDKVPLIGDLPLIGALFSHDKKIISNSELLVMISPHIHEYKGLTKYQTRKFNEIKKAKPLQLPQKNRPEYEILEENLPSYLD